MTRLTAFLPRLVALTILWLLATAALTLAAGQKLSSSTPPPAPVTPATIAASSPVLVVPDVRRQAYVFAKGILQDAGFAWQVRGKVQGYASNTVIGQLPAPGTRLVGSGSPTITLELAKGSYPQDGVPENASPFTGTAVKSVAAAAAGQKQAKTAATTAAKAAGAVAKPAAKAAAKPKPAPRKRPPAFAFPGAKPEPLDEIPLTERATRLDAWLAKHQKPTNANVNHWLYQHAWVVTGAEQGWWHGAEALKILIRADRRAEQTWGIGGKSEALARAALAQVESRSS